MEEEIRALKKSSKINRILLIIVLCFSLLSVVCFAGIGIGGMLLYRAAEPYAEELSSVTPEDISNTVETMRELSEYDWDGLKESLDSVDFDKLSKTLESYDASDIEKAMDSLSQAADAFDTISAKVLPILELFSR